MPIYEYECRACGHRFEILQKVSATPLSECVQCGGNVERLLSSPAIQFKGSGWYITDYARKDQSSASKSSEKSSEKTSASNDSSSETSRKSGPAASASSTTKD